MTALLRPFACALAIAACLSCAAASKDAPPTAAPATATGLDPKSFFPLATGNEWTYEAKGGGAPTRETIRIVGKDGAWYLDDHKGKIRFEDDGVRDQDRYLLRSPLAAGKTWTAVDNMVVQRFEVVATDAKVTVPAGTYEQVVVVKNDQALPNGARFVTEWSYAPGVGLIAMRTSTVAAGHQKEQMSVQLVGFKPKDPR